MWRSSHQPIRIMNCNLSFTFLIGRNEASNTDNHTRDAARESGMVLSTWCEIFSPEQLYLAGTIIHSVQVRKLRCIGIRKLAQVHTVRSYLSWVSNQSRDMPYGHSIYSPGLYFQVYKRQVWATERTEKSSSLGKEKLISLCCLSPNTTQSGRRIELRGPASYPHPQHAICG